MKVSSIKSGVRNPLLFAGVTVLLFGFLVGEFQAKFWSHDYARKQALQAVTEFCQQRNWNPALLTNPREDTVGNTLWSFQWHYGGQPRYLIGVWFSNNGRPEFYTGPTDDPGSAAYEPH